MSIIGTEEIVDLEPSKNEDILDAVARNDEERVKYLVEEKHVPLNTVNEQKQNVAHVAAEEGHLNILMYLLSKDASLLQGEDVLGNQPFHLAVENGNLVLVQYLVEQFGADIFLRIELRLGNTAVHLAVQGGHLPVLQYFIEKRYANYNLRNTLGESLLLVAAERQHLHIVKYLVEKWNADVNMVDNSEQNILFASAKAGDLHVPQYLLDERNITSLDVNKRDLSGRTIIFFAAAFGYLDFMKYFVEGKNADFNIPDFKKSTPLHQAASAGNVLVVSYLIARNADVNAMDTSGKTPLDLATDEDVEWYLKRALHMRMVRSVPPDVSISHAPENQTISVFYGQMPDEFSGQNTNRIEWSGDGNATAQRAAVSNFHVDCFLSLVNIFLHRYDRVRYQRSWQTPTELVQSRMDPVAMAIINANNLKFEKS